MCSQFTEIAELMSRASKSQVVLPYEIHLPTPLIIIMILSIYELGSAIINRYSSVYMLIVEIYIKK